MKDYETLKYLGEEGFKDIDEQYLLLGCGFVHPLSQRSQRNRYQEKEARVHTIRAYSKFLPAKVDVNRLAIKKKESWKLFRGKESMEKKNKEVKVIRLLLWKR